MERRFDHRQSVDSIKARVELALDSPAVEAGVRNISGAGAQLLVAEPANVGSIVKIDISGFVLFGEVHYYKRDGDRFLVGIQFTPRLSPREVDKILTATG